MSAEPRNTTTGVLQGIRALRATRQSLADCTGRDLNAPLDEHCLVLAERLGALSAWLTDVSSLNHEVSKRVKELERVVGGTPPGK